MMSDAFAFALAVAVAATVVEDLWGRPRMRMLVSARKWLASTDSKIVAAVARAARQMATDLEVELVGPDRSYTYVYLSPKGSVLKIRRELLDGDAAETCCYVWSLGSRTPVPDKVVAELRRLTRGALRIS